MQIQSLRIKSYRSWHVNDNAGAIAITRLHQLELYAELKAQGCDESLRLKTINCSRATYYRWSNRYQRWGLRGLEGKSSRPKQVRQRQWTRQQEQAVLHLRQYFKTWGKRKIRKVLVRDQEMSAIKACSLWLPPERLSLNTAFLLSIGGLGAMTSTAPLHQALTWISWREAFMILAGLTTLISAITLFSAPRTYIPKKTHFGDMCKEVGQLYRAWGFWRLVLYSIVAHATYMAVLALWMAPWLQDVAGLNTQSMAEALMLGTVAMVLGSLTFGGLTDYLQRYGIQPIMVCGTGIAIFVCFQLLMINNPSSISPFLFVMGFSFFGTSTTMNYAIVAQSVPQNLVGRVSASFNLLVFALAFIVQWLIGGIIELWDKVDGRYPVEAYQWALGIIAFLQILGLLLWLTFKPWRRYQSIGSYV